MSSQRPDRLSTPPQAARRRSIPPAPVSEVPPEPTAGRVPPFLSALDPDPPVDPDTAIDPVPWTPQERVVSAGTLYNAVSVRVDRTGRCLDFDASDAVFRKGDAVAVECDPGGPCFGIVTQMSRRMMCRGRLHRVLRRANESELRTEPRGRRREKEVFRIARHVAGTLNLPIKIVRAESEPGGKTTVFFASEDRIDFRELHRRVSAAAQGRVELRQIGVRDAAKMSGGMGPCGQLLCCARFLKEFAPISIKMAKDQGLVLNPQRVSGLCGRLLCCLTYEDALYRTQRKLLPKLGKRVLTPKGPGKVRDVDVLAQTVRVTLDAGDIASFKAAEVSAMFPPPPGQGSARVGGSPESRERDVPDDNSTDQDADTNEDP